jgi:Cellulase (glycosyl hydrolase family 5)
MTHAMTRILIAAALTLGAWLSLGGTAHARAGMDLALQDDAVIVGQEYFDRERAFRHARELGVNRIRMNLIWRYTSPRSNSRRGPRSLRYSFGSYDSAVDAARANGFSVHLSITGPAPRWAASSRNGVRRPKASRFAGFARAVAKHFAGRVDRYSIWNEPNHLGWLAPRRSAARLYRSLYRAGYRGIKSQDSGAFVLIGETSPFELGNGRVAESPLTFLSKVTCTNRRFRGRRCPPLTADGYAHHPYDFERAPNRKHPDRRGVTMATLPRLTSALSRLRSSRALRTPRGGALDLFLTEFGYLRSGSRRMSEGRRALYLKRAYTMARRHPRVHQMTHYLLIQPSAKYRFFDTSLMNRRGTPFRSFRALRAWAN